MVAFVLVGWVGPDAAGAKIVVAPKGGERVASSPVRVSVRAPWKLEELRVWLNGQSLTREFDRANVKPNDRRTVKASASHGLRYGENVLRVSKQRYGHKPRREKVRFNLAGDRPLVGAGRDRRIHVGRSIRLNARSSRPRDAFGGGARAAEPPGSPEGLAMRWQLVRKPSGSEAELQDYPDGVQPSDEVLAQQPDPGAQPARPRLEADVPGIYVSELVVVDAGVESVADRVVTTAVVNAPLVPINTAADIADGNSLEFGIAVGYHPAPGGDPPDGPSERFFAADPGGAGRSAIQLVVLDRETLETVTSRTFAADRSGVDGLTDQLRELEDDKLVVVTAWEGEWEFGMTQALTDDRNAGVGLIGAAPTNDAQVAAYGLENHGQLSWIGVPGFEPGEAWQIGQPFDADKSFEPPGLKGFLTFDNNDNYAYIGTGPTTYDLGPPGQSVSVSVGENVVNGSLPEGQGGFLVAYFDGITLEPASVAGVPNGAVYATRAADGSANINDMRALAGALNSLAVSGEPLLVAVRSIGAAPLAKMGLQPPKYEGELDPVFANALDSLTERIAFLGGDRQPVYGMSTTPTADDSYALLGSNYAFNDIVAAGEPTAIPGPGAQSLLVSSEGSGADAGSQVRPAGNARISGVLSRDKQSRYIAKMTAGGPTSAALAEVAVAEPSEWPYSSSDGQRAALTCIGNAQGLGPDPRSAYWLQTYSESRWEQTQTSIRDMQASQCADVPAQDFTDVQTELVTEIGWLINVQSYIAALTAPFSDSGLTSFAELQTITNEVVAAVSPPPSRPAGIDGLDVFADLFDLVAETADALEPAGAVAAVFFLIGDFTATSDDGPTIDWGQRVETSAGQVGEQLAQQMQTIASENENLADIIAGDYEKLKTVGTLGQCTPGAQGCTPEWQFTQEQQNTLSRAYQISAERQIWGGVLPAGYPFVLFENSNPGSYDGTFVGPQEEISSIGCDFYEPFHTGTGDNQEQLPEPVFFRWGIRVVADTNFMVFSQENFDGSKDVPPTMFPPRSLLTSLFSPLDPGGDPDKGGLGLDQYEFMVGNWALQGIGGAPGTRAVWEGCR